ncbi:MAG: butyrate kinase [Bacteroidales bacterium]
MNSYKILVIYPEANSTILAFYLANKATYLKTINHPKEVLDNCNGIIDQLPYRLEIIKKELEQNEIDLKEIEIIVGRSGLLKPLKSGSYEVNDQMKRDLESQVYGKDIINLGGLIAYELAQEAGIKAVISDPVVTDELNELARITGCPELKRKSIFHALSHKYIGKKYAESIQKQYADLNLIIAHVGASSVSVASHEKGRVIDVNNAFDGDGPFGVRRTGSLPVGDLVQMCFSGDYTYDEVVDMVVDNGGYKAYLGTDNLNELNNLVNAGNEKALLISRAFAYHLSKEISSHYAVLKGKIDGIILTGFIHHSPRLIDDIRERLQGLASLSVIPSVQNYDIMASIGLSILKREREILQYSSEK